MIRPDCVATRGYLDNGTLGIASRGYLKVDVEVRDNVSGSLIGNKKINYRYQQRYNEDEEEIMLLLKIFTNVCLK